MSVNNKYYKVKLIYLLRVNPTTHQYTNNETNNEFYVFNTDGNGCFFLNSW